MNAKGLGIIFAAVLIAILLSGSAKSSSSSAPVSHAPIFVGNNSSFTPANGVTSGSGTKNNPYIIENWEIDAGSGTGIQISSTSVYFILRNCKVTNGQWGISLSSVSNGTVTGNQCFDYTEAGIYLYSSSNNKVTNNTCSWTKIYSVVDKQWHDTSVAWVYSQAYDDWSGGINTYGIDLSGTSQNNLIDGNTCMNNVSCGIHNGWAS